MSRIEQLIEESEKDLSIDYSGNIGIAVSQQPTIFVKWLKLLKEQSLKHRMLLLKEEKLNSDLTIYYTGKADPEVYRTKPMNHRFLKSEVKEAIAADQDMIKLRAEIAISVETLDTLERIVKAVKDRDWQLKNIIEWRKFSEGIA